MPSFVRPRELVLLPPSNHQEPTAKTVDDVASQPARRLTAVQSTQQGDVARREPFWRRDARARTRCTARLVCRSWVAQFPYGDRGNTAYALERTQKPAELTTTAFRHVATLRAHSDRVHAGSDAIPDGRLLGRGHILSAGEGRPGGRLGRCAPRI